MHLDFNLAAFICSHVFENTRPILFVSRSDGDWQFLCGETHPDEVPDVVCIGHLLQRDATLRDILDLHEDWEAEREFVGGDWERRPCIVDE